MSIGVLHHVMLKPWFEWYRINNVNAICWVPCWCCRKIVHYGRAHRRHADKSGRGGRRGRSSGDGDYSPADARSSQQPRLSCCGFSSLRVWRIQQRWFVNVIMRILWFANKQVSQKIRGEWAQCQNGGDMRTREDTSTHARTHVDTKTKAPMHLCVSLTERTDSVGPLEGWLHLRGCRVLAE